MAQELKRSSTPFFTESVKKIITSYVWPGNIRDAVENLEINWLKGAMSEAGDHQGKAAELLGLNYNQFRGLYRKYQSML